MAKQKRTNNDLENTTQKPKDCAMEIHRFQGWTLVLLHQGHRPCYCKVLLEEIRCKVI